MVKIFSMKTGEIIEIPEEKALKIVNHGESFMIKTSNWYPVFEDATKQYIGFMANGIFQEKYK